MKKKLFLLTLMLYGFFAFGQNKQPSVSQSTGDFSASVSRARTFAPNGIVRCASTEYTKSKQARRTVPSDDVFEAWLAPKIAEIQRLRQLGRLPSVIKIPVVVHVIHNGDAVGSGENILDGQVLSQITVFNQDYRKLTGTPGFGAGVDTTIEFCMAQVDPSGNPTNGIDRRNLGIASFNSAAVETAKANTIWDPTKYLNMWTFRFTGDLNGVLGYAQFPTGSGLDGMPTEDCITGEASTDGVVCSFNTWGSRTIFPTGSYGGTQYDKGRTMTHEVGHMFGLRHTWGDGDCTVDDFCADTPNCSADYYAGAGTGGCIAPTQCGVTRQIQNYMDYSDDGCMNIFTQDQKDRMLAVLMNSPRRDDLLVSTVCTSSSPYIQFKRPVCEQRPVKSVIEGNGCSYTEFTVPLSIDKAPSANAVVTFMVDGTSVANASDIQIMTPSVTFNAGSTAEQNLVFRVLNDVYVETDEELVLTFTVNANGGNALANPNGGSLFNLKIMNDDTALAAVLPGQQIFYDGFETYPDFTIGNVGGWTMLDNDGKSTYVDDTYNFPNEGYTGTFIVFNPSQTTPSAAGSGYDAHSGSKGYYCYNAETPAPALNSDYIFTPQISLGTNSQLKFWAKSLTNNYNGGERFKVLVSTTNTNPASFTLISTFPYTIPPLTWTEYTYNLSAYNNQNVYIAIQCVSADEFVFMLDDVEVLSDVAIAIESNVNTPTAGQNILSGSGTAAFMDQTTRDIAARVTVNDASSYGCTSAAVTRAGSSALQYGSSVNVLDYAMSKQFTITPASVVSGNATITFYFTEAEIAGWEAFTGNNRSLLYVARDGVSREVQPLTIGSFGTGVTLTATFTGGIQGVYSFARQQSLPTDNFEFNEIGLFPNPNNGTFNIQFTPSSEKTNVVIFDVRGRVIFDQQYQNNGLFNESIQLDNVESGIYLVKIQDGSRKITKKIIVE
ncbi:T9SS type A sorting domain-containing protein [Flavobacterium sp. LMO6]|uniref:T9SS-dependent choice-of-anchor J family protein n=3 Tax=unclassified Flavobacterium TaxID=196869 RepID=UPI00129251AD|nr:choice-of-anchor J domain-containing protein [Flavobacterium sp. LMO6]MQP63321.1 T9SS type A sorting domain-containing protein [Flavobacterium sp. LMO6]